MPLPDHARQKSLEDAQRAKEVELHGVLKVLQVLFQEIPCMCQINVRSRAMHAQHDALAARLQMMQVKRWVHLGKRPQRSTQARPRFQHI